MSIYDIYTLLFNSELTSLASLARIGVSFVCGAILGAERQKRNQFIGIRTITIITVSSTLLMLLSIYAGTQLPGSTGDPTRIAAQVVSGIGFLGAGTIVLQGLNIKGLTSSAVIWSSAAVGLAIGAGFIVPAIVTVFLLVTAIIIVEKIEEKYFPAGRSKKLEFSFFNNRVDVDGIATLLISQGLVIVNTDISRDFTKKHIVITYFVRVPPSIDIFNIIDQVKGMGKLEEFSLTD